MEKDIQIVRTKFTDQGTFGVLEIDHQFFCFTGELPWRDNKEEVSCIPEGVYQVEWRLSPKFGECYHVENVQARSNILIHAANFMGDRGLGYRSDLLGCIALGEKLGVKPGVVQTQIMLLQSRPALNRFIDEMAKASFSLTIHS